MKLTKAQIELVRWMLKQEEKALASEYRAVRDRANRFTGGDLISYYAERAAKKRAEWDAGDHSEPEAYRGSGGYARHGWRRAGGSTLARMADAGVMEQTGYLTHSPEYRMTDEARRSVGDA